MWRSSFLVLTFLATLLGLGCRAIPATSGTCDGAISWERANESVGKQVTVKGPVVETNYASQAQGQPTYLDLGKAYPDPSRFTIVIRGENRSKFTSAPEVTYKGKTICVTGVVKSNRGIYEVEVESPASLVVSQ